MQANDIFPAELLFKQRNAHQRSARQRRVSNAERVLVKRIRRYRLPRSRLRRDFVRVDDDAERPKAYSRKRAVVVVERINQVFKTRRLILFEQALVFHLVEVGNFACPNYVSHKVTALTFGVEFRHNLARARRLPINVDAGILFLETLDDVADKRFLHRRVDNELVGVGFALAARVGRIVAATDRQKQCRKQQHRREKFFEHVANLRRKFCDAIIFACGGIFNISRRRHAVRKKNLTVEVP